jgi:hypothetical protein
MWHIVDVTGTKSGRGTNQYRARERPGPGLVPARPGPELLVQAVQSSGNQLVTVPDISESQEPLVTLELDQDELEYLSGLLADSEARHTGDADPVRETIKDLRGHWARTMEVNQDEIGFLASAILADSRETVGAHVGLWVKLDAAAQAVPWC